MATAFIFPGQGSQSLGMGQALAENYAEARAVFAAVDEAVGQNLSDLMWNGPEDKLTLTENAQPALMAVSIAALRVLQARGLVLEKTAKFVAGHSLGEYSALTAAGSLTLETAAQLLKLRGQAMQRAVPVGAGAMAAILGLEIAAVDDIAARATKSNDELCQVANDNASGQVVVSGHVAAVARAIDIAKESGASRAIELPVSAPFHCALMQPASDEMADALAKTEIVAPCVPLLANVCAAPVHEPEEISRLLVAQVTGRVRWRESMLYLAEQNVTQLVELGHGKVLTGMAKRIDKRLMAQALNKPEDIDNFLQK